MDDPSSSNPPSPPPFPRQPCPFPDPFADTTFQSVKELIANRKHNSERLHHILELLDDFNILLWEALDKDEILRDLRSEYFGFVSLIKSSLNLDVFFTSLIAKDHEFLANEAKGTRPKQVNKFPFTLPRFSASDDVQDLLSDVKKTNEEALSYKTKREYAEGKLENFKALEEQVAALKRENEKLQLQIGYVQTKENFNLVAEDTMRREFFLFVFRKKEEEAVAYKTKLEGVLENLKALEEQVAAVKLENEKLRAEIDRVQTPQNGNVEAEYETRTANLLSDLKKKEEEALTYKTKLEYAEGKLENLKALEEQVAAVELENEKLRAEIGPVQIKELETEYKTRTTNLLACLKKEEEALAYKTELESLQEKVDALKRENNELRAEIGPVQTQEKDLCSHDLEPSLHASSPGVGRKKRPNRENNEVPCEDLCDEHARERFKRQKFSVHISSQPSSFRSLEKGSADAPPTNEHVLRRSKRMHSHVASKRLHHYYSSQVHVRQSKKKQGSIENVQINAKELIDVRVDVGDMNDLHRGLRPSNRLQRYSPY